MMLDIYGHIKPGVLHTIKNQNPAMTRDVT